MKVCEGDLSSCTILPSSGHGRKLIIVQSFFLFVFVSFIKSVRFKLVSRRQAFKNSNKPPGTRLSKWQRTIIESVKIKQENDFNKTTAIKWHNN